MAAQNAPKTQRGTVKDLGDWGLADMIAVAAELNILADDDGVTAVGLTKNYRNLIHPGRAARRGQKCDRATAYSAIGGMMYIIQALKP